MRIGVDVDLTTVESDIAWWDWLLCMCDPKPEYSDYIEIHTKLEEFIENLELYCNEQISYNLTQYFEKPSNDNVDSMDFWRNEGVYDTIKVRLDAVRIISRLMAEGHEIVFITHNKGNGSRSKYNLLARTFGKGKFAYVVTKEKYLVDVDILIDDRHDFCNQMLQKGKHVALFETPYVQYTDLRIPYVQKSQFREVRNWLEFYQFIQDLENGHVS